MNEHAGRDINEPFVVASYKFIYTKFMPDDDKPTKCYLTTVYLKIDADGLR